MSCTDDASSCVREAAVKFADQNVDSPLDLMLLTGRTALARHAHSLVRALKTKKPDDIRALCHADPFLYALSLSLSLSLSQWLRSFSVLGHIKN